MDILSTTHDALTATGTGLIDAVRWVFGILKPTLDVLVPATLAILVRRYVNNDVAASALATAAGVAYSTATSLKHENPGMLYEDAKQAGIEAGTLAINAFVQKHLAHLTPEEVADRVEGAFGKLLANDPSVSIVKDVPAPVTITAPPIGPARDAVAAAFAALHNGVGSADPVMGTIKLTEAQPSAPQA